MRDVSRWWGICAQDKGKKMKSELQKESEKYNLKKNKIVRGNVRKKDSYRRGGENNKSEKREK